MKAFGGSTLFLDRNDINTDEIIPAKYLTENSKLALKPYMLEDLRLPDFNPAGETAQQAKVVVTRQNFGCGSSREHAVWVFEVNDINVVIGESFARIFRQNMFNCGMLAIELPAADIEALFTARPTEIAVDLDKGQVITKGATEVVYPFILNSFDRDLVLAGGWLAYADKKY
ncbi:MAG: 3-isopropylmalate dehydratase small subunit [Proteobacteria bacterium]|nr:3-isopropylmalate dehydratase small subunit [Desulfobulbaceae bacterium]MBU4153623.1 3-isopropylmalate dehydratase small subunit [Pseudomonadota bacterium]